MKNYAVSIWVDRGDQVDIELEVTGTVSVFVRASTHRLPENCHPSEGGEVEISTITLDGKEWDGELTETERDKAEEKLFEACQDDDDDGVDESDDDEDEYDYADHDDDFQDIPEHC